MHEYKNDEVCARSAYCLRREYFDRQTNVRFCVRKIEFGRKWRSWISACISTVRIFVLVNEVPTRQFKMRKGLQQGCSLSPFLFNCVVEAYIVLMSEAVRLGICSGIDIGCRGLVMSYLQFRDDTTITCKHEWESIRNVKMILRCFQLISSLKINFQKSIFFGISLEEETIAEWVGRISYRIEKFPSRHLGMPLGVKIGS